MRVLEFDSLPPSLPLSSRYQFLLGGLWPTGPQRKCRCGNVYDSMIRKETVWWLNRSPVIILISLIYLVKGFTKTQRKTKTEFQGGGAFISSHSGGANWPCFVGASQVTRPVIFTQLSKFRMFGGPGVLMWRVPSKDKIPEQDSIIILPVNIKARRAG